MRKIEEIEADFMLLQKELRENIVALMQDYGDEKMPLYRQDLKNPTTLWYYEDLIEEYRMGRVISVIFRNDTLLLEVENEFGDTLQLNEDWGDLVFDVPYWMLAIYRNMVDNMPEKQDINMNNSN
jgi:hypothetical protein